MIASSGAPFPGSVADLVDWFPTDEACLDYLDWLRWGSRFRCPHCDGTAGWRLPDGRRSCATCGRRASATAGTILHRARSPLPVWFAVAWALTGGDGTPSALGLQRELGLGSYQTAWAMLHKYRLAMSGAGLQELSGTVDVGLAELDRTGGTRTTGAGGSTLAVAVERRRSSLGRCRLRVVERDDADALRAFLADSVVRGSDLRSGGATWRSFVAPARELDLRMRQTAPVVAAGDAVQEVGALVAGWLLGPLHGAVRDAHLPAYLDEFAFRFDGSGATPPGVLFHRLLAQVVSTPPVRSSDLVRRPAPRTIAPSPTERPRRPHVRRVVASADHPWRRP